MITSKLTSFMQPASVVTVGGAGHMGPVSHAEIVARAIGTFIRSTEPAEATHVNRDRMRQAA
jgi:hypothetical protein